MRQDPKNYCGDSRSQVVEQTLHTLEAMAESPLFKSFIRELYQEGPLSLLREKDADELLAIAQWIWNSIESYNAYKPEPLIRIETLAPRKLHSLQGKTCVTIILQHVPFVIDSLISFLAREGYLLQTILHPILKPIRDASHKITGFHATAAQQPEELLIYMELNEQITEEESQRLKEKILSILQDIHCAVQDWGKMRHQVNEALFDLDKGYSHFETTEKKEIQGLLQWLDRGYFTFLGYRDYDQDGKKGELLGILRNKEAPLFADTPENEERFFEKGFLKEKNFLITKTRALSTIHRLVPMDVLCIKKFDASGLPVGERQFFGLFTSSVYSHSVQDIPLLRKRTDHVLTCEGATPDSHKGKVLLHILESFPRDEFFQADISFMVNTAQSIMDLKERQRLALFVRKDPLEHIVSCLIYVPRDRFNSNFREKISHLLQQTFQGAVLSFTTEMGGDLTFARVHFLIATSPLFQEEVSVESLETHLHQLSLTWEERLKEHMVEMTAPEASRLFVTFGHLFSEGYKESFSPHEALKDIRLFQTLAQKPLAVILQRIDNNSSFVSLKLYQANKPIIISDILPILGNMALRVVTETSYCLQNSPSSLWLHHFQLEIPSSFKYENLSHLQQNIEECLVEIGSNQVENDRLNALMVTTHLHWRDITILRAYFKYLKQIHFPFDVEFLEKTLSNHPEVTQDFISLFYGFFHPRQIASTNETQTKITQLEEKLRSVDDANSHKILTSFMNLLLSTLRTNYFVVDKETGKNKSYISFKFDCKTLMNLPLPKPVFEIFVYSPWVEAVHLRGGKVARGGIRWSSRLDFRKEVLDLVKAQMVKNTVIVPVGAKGGFFIKNTSDTLTYEERQKQGIFCYQTMIRGLLDITDNLIDSKSISPQNVVCRDTHDPYLVVAADKGTATFSDIANQLSLEYGFWLKDAFASGGSAGYDHKKMAITSRGAWISVSRHFKEMGFNVQTDPFTVVGVGDMSGDVFGNAMLLSEKIRLIAAFNHTHIFIDPNPNEEKSFQERRRLFNLPRSNWDNYDQTLLSPGGMIINRREKIITLTPEIRTCFAISAEVITPDELIRTLLRAEVDLIWFGGIGTFVKAASESHEQVGDRTNDELRVNAQDLQCKVIGEGANLGMTQRGRIEYAAKGGRLNTDAIDNSGGVDCSDHEVNIKILLEDPSIQQNMTVEERNTLLAKMTDEVARLVLRNNYLQTQAISIAHTQGTALLEKYIHLIETLEKEGKLNRDLETLPNEKTLNEYKASGRSFTRPEIAILLAYGKIFVFEQIINTPFIKSSLLNEMFYSYFPNYLSETFRSEIDRHPLKQEIIATLISNHVVNHMGPTFLSEMMLLTNATAEDILQAYFVVFNSFRLDSDWESIEQLDYKIPAPLQYTLLLQITHVVESNLLWLLRHPKTIHHFSIHKEDACLLVNELIESVEKEKTESELIQKGVPQKVAKKAHALSLMGFAYGIIESARHMALPLSQVAQLFFKVQERFDIHFFRTALGSLGGTLWEKRAAHALHDQLLDVTSSIVTSIFEETTTGDLALWCSHRLPRITKADELLQALKRTEKLDISILFVALRSFEEMI